MTAASGLRARTESLEMLANNLANATTAGFKADREFYSTYFAPVSLDGPAGTLPAHSPVVEKNWVDFQQGISTPTGSSLDIALEGQGFLKVQSGQDIMYTRNGNLRIGGDGSLTTQSGYSVLGLDGRPIRLNSTLDVAIDEKGLIRQGGKDVAQLAIMDFENRQSLTKTGTTYFRYETPEIKPQPGAAKVQQGRLEAANFQPAEAAVRLTSVLRQFEMLQRAITLGAEMNRRAVEEVAKVRE